MVEMIDEGEYEVWMNDDSQGKFSALVTCQIMKYL